MEHNFKIGNLVLHPIDNEPFRVDDTTEDKVLITGNFSGGTHPVVQSDWVSYKELKLYKTNPCVEDCLLRDNNNRPIQLGDKVRILKMVDDSDTAVNIYGVEPQLNGWVSNVYFEEFEGEVIFNKELLMYMIEGKKTSIPLSPVIRFNSGNGLIDQLESDAQKELQKELGLKDSNYETFIDYIEKI